MSGSRAQDMLTDPPAGQVQWLRAGWLIDGSGGPAEAGCAIGLRDGRVETIMPAGDEGLEAALDFSAATVLPALVDAHVHLALDPEGVGEVQRAGEPAIRERLRRYQNAGVLTVRDGGDCSGLALACKGSGPADGPPVHVAAAGWGWHAAGRYGKLIARACPAGLSLAQAAATQANADHVKIIQSGINSLDHFAKPTAAQFAPRDLRATVRAAHAAGRPVMVHANGAAPVAAALAAGCDSIEHGYFMGYDNLACMAERQIVWVPTVVPMAALAQSAALSPAQRDIAQRTVEHQMSQIALAHQLGVPLAAGTDAGSPGVAHGTSLWQELALLVSAGLTLEAAVACATRNAARLLRKERQGALQPGRRADLIVVAGDPGRLLPGGRVVAIHHGGRWWRGGSRYL